MFDAVDYNNNLKAVKGRFSEKTCGDSKDDGNIHSFKWSNNNNTTFRKYQNERATNGNKSQPPH